MSKFVYDPTDFANNPHPRCPCVLLLDTSGSMEGSRINQLNAGLLAFRDGLRNDDVANRSVEVSVVTFGPVKVLPLGKVLPGGQDNFVIAHDFELKPLGASGNTPMGEAIRTGIDLVNERKTAYRDTGTGYYRPWLVLITDGAPTDDVTEATRLIREGEAARRFVFHAVGVEDANMRTLGAIAGRQPEKLNGLDFSGLFQWLSSSLRSVARGPVSAPPPNLPKGWAKP